MRLSTATLQNFTHFPRHYLTCASVPAVTRQCLFRLRSTRCLDFWEIAAAHFASYVQMLPSFFYVKGDFVSGCKPLEVRHCMVEYILLNTAAWCDMGSCPWCKAVARP